MLYRRQSSMGSFFMKRGRRGDDLAAETFRHHLRPAFPLIDFGQFGKDRPTLELTPHVTRIEALAHFDQPTTRSGSRLFRFCLTRHLVSFSSVIDRKSV